MGKLSTRSLTLEEMDETELDVEELQDTLQGIERMNTLFGGNRCSLTTIDALVPPDCREISIVDVGTGAGEIPRRLVTRLAERGIKANILGIDLAETSVAFARSRSAAFSTISFERVDLFDLDRQFDIVHCAAMLHHVGDDAAIVRALGKMASLAKRAVVVNDLHRHPLAYYPIRTLAPLITRNRLVHNDAPLSVWRAFTKDELLDFATQAAWPAPKVTWHPMFRWILETRTNQSER